MVKRRPISPEDFEELLAWLDPNREVAGEIYAQIHHDIAKLFNWRGCEDAEALTDQVFDIVARKAKELRQSYEGDPRFYFHAVAKNLIKENLKKVGTHVPFEEADLSHQITDDGEEPAVDREECLESCLAELSPDKRELILQYYAKEKQAKIDNRHELAKRLGISIENLRVRAFRLKPVLVECVERCLQKKQVDNETD
jgi:RNA polymerase sigma factor (sigma-70 family)